LLAHNRAFLNWLDDLLDRHPGLTIENCASGGMRTDYALLSRCQLQSTSDQQDFLRYPAIAAAAPAAIAPE
jgi:alpha-galactosidase